jgi:hypothetical protein
MESKKINQLATELTPALSDLTIIGDPTTGISKKITLSQMASLFTGTVEEYPSLASFPLVGVADTIYIALDTNVLYRWNTGTSAYVELSPNIINSLVFSDANGFDGNISLVGSVATLTITTALTTGSVPFIGASGALSQDNANLFFDDTNNRLGINTNSPTTALDVFGSGIIGRINGTSTNNAFLGFASAGTNRWSIGNVQSDHRFRIYNEATTSELISVLSTGEFGIGIANPTTKLHIDGGASALIANLDANVSVAKSVSFRSDNSNRFNIEVSGTESGSNAGADFFIRSYSDAGALLNTPITITRSTGAISLATALNGTSASFNSSITSNGNGLYSKSTLGTVTTAVETDNTAGYLGTNTNHPLVLRTNSTAVLSLSTTGAATFSNTLSASSATFNSSANNYPGSALRLNSFTPGTSIYLVASNDGNFYLSNGGTTDHLIISSTGAATFRSSIRVNNASDIARLSVFGTSGNPSMTADTNNLFTITGSLGPQLNIGGYNGASYGMWLQVKDANNTSINYPILLQPLGGAVGIGTASPGAILHVLGGTSGSSGRSRLTHATSGAQIDTYVGASDGCGIIVNNNPLWFEVNSVERMRITSAGKFQYGTSSDWIFNIQSSAGGYLLNSHNTRNVSGDVNALFQLGNNANNTSSYFLVCSMPSGDKMYILGNGNVQNTNNSYGAISDIKLKENIVDATPKLENLLKVKIRNYNLIGEETKQIGVIAQELEQIFPSMVDETEDFKEVEIEDEEGNIIKERQSLGTTTKSVKYSVFVPILIKAIQELKTEIDTLKNK